MGIFDTYGDIQMKMGEPWQRQFKVGDSVKESEVDDGVYLSDPSDGKAIVIIDGMFMGSFDVFDYFGDRYTWKES